MYISILLIEKKSIYFLFNNCEKVIKIQNETAPLTAYQCLIYCIFIQI